MPQSFDIVRLSPRDISRLRALLNLFARAFEDPDTYLGHQPDDAYLSQLLAKPHVIAIAATIGDHVVGGLVAYELDKFEQDRREIYIYDLAVDAAHRRRGIATATIQALQAEAVRRDAYVIYVQADIEDAPAIALYESLGTKEEVLHFDIAPRRPRTSRGRKP